jgi:8-oxo-dGTP diphosphatase
MKLIKVVCGIIRKEGQVFIAKRKPEKSQGGYWEFPGGKLEANEHPNIALIRELDEELGMQIKLSKFFGSHVHHYESISIELLAYECEFVSATFKLTDHDEIKFVTPEELRNYKIAPADQFIVDKLLA